MIVTRFNPSITGNLHLGHLFSMLVNEHYAHDNGGKFIVRFDDTSAAALAVPEDHRKLMMEYQRKDLEWVEIPVDMWQVQSEIVPEIHTKMYRLWKPVHDDPCPELPLFTRMGTTWQPYPYQAWQTAERVLMDHSINVTHVIRGEEFSTEYSLYRYFCEIFNIPAPHFIFLPRLMGAGSDISKTNGGYTLTELRGKGYTAKDLKDLIAVSALNWHSYGWQLYNIKPNPRIDL